MFVTSILALVESIMYLTKTPEEFKRLYIDAKKDGLMKNNKPKTSFTYLIFGAFLTFLSYGHFPHDQIHPLYSMLSFLPLQIGVVIWIYLNGYLKGFNKNF